MTFEEWLVGTERELEVLAPLLDEELSDEPNHLEGQLRKLESHGFRLLRLYTEAEVYLRKAQGNTLKAFAKQGGTLNMLEKERYMDMSCCEEERVYNLLRGLIGDRNNTGLLARRVSLGQTFLASHRARIQMGGDV